MMLGGLTRDQMQQDSLAELAEQKRGALWCGECELGWQSRLHVVCAVCVDPQPDLPTQFAATQLDLLQNP